MMFVVVLSTIFLDFAPLTAMMIVAARRRPDHDHCLRQYPGECEADPLAHAAAP
jgi:hypothetical protein